MDTVLTLETAPTDGSLLRRFTIGQKTAADELYARYASRIRALARTRLSDDVAARLDADDVVQSVFRSFFESACQGLYRVPNGETLWRLLAVVTVNKVRSIRAFHVAAKRDARNTVSWGDSERDSPIANIDSEFLEVAIRDVLEQLPEPERVAVELRMEGHEVTEIAMMVHRSKRSVERLLQKARQQLSVLLDEIPA